MGTATTLIFVVTSLLISDFAAGIFDSGRCPPKSKVYNKDPVCHSDADCQRWGKVCCPNQYNARSCSYPAPYRNDGQGSDKYYGGMGKNCGNDKDKYRPYEMKLRDKITGGSQRSGVHEFLFADKNILL